MQPTLDIDIYGDAVLADPYPAYRRLRDTGPAVYLPSCDAWFIGRFADVRAALQDWQSFSSAQGIGLNPVINAAWSEALICTDPPDHGERRRLMTAVLSPAALKPVADTIRQRADALADRLAAMGDFDGVADFAHDLPIGLVMDLIGWPEDVRPRLLALAEGSWNAAGPPNARMHAGLVQLQDMMAVIAEIFDKNRVTPGGFASHLVEAARSGVISRDTAIGMLAGYIVAAFETTISAMASGLWLFAQNPDQWNRLRDDPGRAINAATEIVRIESPLQNFTRVTTREVHFGDDVIIPAGARVILSYASANRDERQFADPDRFIIERPQTQNLGFGFGPHNCAGQGLARMELSAVFAALASRIARFELWAAPTRALNNIARSFRALPIRAVIA